MKYQTTYALVNWVRPGTFQNGYQGYSGLGSSVALTTNAMLGLALGAVGMVLYLKQTGQLKTA
jgi:hypothetical protein